MSTKTTEGFHAHSIDVDTRAWQEKTAMLMYLQKKEVGYITTERFLGASFSSHSTGFWEAQNVNLNSSAKHQFVGQRQKECRSGCITVTGSGLQCWARAKSATLGFKCCPSNCFKIFEEQQKQLFKCVTVVTPNTDNKELAREVTVVIKVCVTPPPME